MIAVSLVKKVIYLHLMCATAQTNFEKKLGFSCANFFSAVSAVSNVLNFSFMKRNKGAPVFGRGVFESTTTQAAHCRLAYARCIRNACIGHPGGIPDFVNQLFWCFV